jgi:hypothetical protein
VAKVSNIWRRISWQREHWSAVLDAKGDSTAISNSIGLPVACDTDNQTSRQVLDRSGIT